MAAGLEAMVRDSGKPMAVWNPREVAAQNVNGECSGHKNRTYPEAPVTMHTPPVGTGARFAALTAISLPVMLASRHLVS